MPDPISWTLIGIFIFLSFFFSASETALACLNRFKMQVRADNGSRTAGLIIKVIDHYDRALTTVLIGNNIVAIVISSLSTILFIRYFNNTGMEEYASIISSVIMSFAVYILGDALAKTIARAIPDTFSFIAIYPVYAMMFVLYPITIVFELLSKALDKMFKNKSDEDFTEEDFENVVEKVSDEGLFEGEQKDILNSALDFYDRKVSAVYTPIEKMFALDIKGLTKDKLGEILLNTRYSRIPIYEGDFNNFIGVLHVKTYLNAIIKNKRTSIRSTLVDIYYINKEASLGKLFTGFKEHHTHLALVTTRKKHVVGMVTMEDVLEELVKDISEPNIVKKVSEVIDEISKKRGDK